MIAGTRSTTLKGVIHDSDDGSTSSLVNADLLAKSLEETQKKQQRIMVPMWDFRLARVTEITRNYQYELEMENTIIPQHGLSLLLDGQQNEKRTYGLPQRLWIQNLFLKFSFRF